MKDRGVHAGDFITCTSLLLSGNNYHKVALMFKFMNVGVPTEPFFHQVQSSYCCPVIDESWKIKQEEIHAELEGTPLVLAGKYNQFNNVYIYLVPLLFHV